MAQAGDTYLAKVLGHSHHSIGGPDQRLVTGDQDQVAHRSIGYALRDLCGFDGHGGVRFRIFVKGQDLKRYYDLVTC